MSATSLRRAASAGVATLGLLAGSSFWVASPAASAGGAAPQVFAYTGAAQRYVVPADVCSVTIDALGAGGGTGSVADFASVTGPVVPDGGAAQPAAAAPVAAPPGLGGEATSTVLVTPGEVLQVNVGGAGGVGAFTNQAGEGGDGGWNGGGTGGDGSQGANGLGGGGGGGGATDVRQGGTAVSDRVVVAGGGGGTGAFSTSDLAPLSIGGNGGNPATPGGSGGVGVFAPVPPIGLPAPADVSGTPGDVEGQVAPTGGGAGTAGAGGAAGIGGQSVGKTQIDGMPGVPALGGDGGTATEFHGGGGGGGGGLYGGGGGGAGASAGGGGGGGGSGLGDTTSAGVRSGDGQVTITPAGDCPPTSTSTTVPTTVASAVVSAAKPAEPVAARPTYTG